MMKSQTFSSLPRVPLITDEIVRRENVYFEVDTRFRRAARYLQCLWLKDSQIETGIHVRGEGDDAVVMPLHSNLSRDAARAGKNFMSPAIHALVRRELLLREEGAAIDQERLFGNALSSMPACFNVFGPMKLDLALASAVFRKLLPNFVQSVEDFIFEHSPGRREERFLHDGTAFDLAMRVITPDGEPATVYIEVKYSESMEGPAARLRPRYDEVSRSANLYIDADSPMLRTLALEQLWREHMLAQLAVDQGITARAMFIAIGPRLNRRVQAAFKVYENELIDEEDRDDNRVAFKTITLEAIFETMHEAGATEIARDLWHRYADFERVYNLALGEFIEPSSGQSPNQVGTETKRTIASGRSTKKQSSKSSGSEVANVSTLNPTEVAR